LEMSKENTNLKTYSKYLEDKLEKVGQK